MRESWDTCNDRESGHMIIIWGVCSRIFHYGIIQSNMNIWEFYYELRQDLVTEPYYVKQNLNYYLSNLTILLL